MTKYPYIEYYLKLNRYLRFFNLPLINKGIRVYIISYIIQTFAKYDVYTPTIHVNVYTHIDLV